MPQPQETAGESALAVLERPFGSLTPAQRELRRMVLDSVTSASTRRSYGHALDQLFAFSAGRPLTRALLQEWKRRWTAWRHRR